uniref:Uncharacterized protein n=1 Tax=Zea mays TaxID=4577 RepID=C4J4E6_MAIZE|nr:unknown [Zea mays]
MQVRIGQWRWLINQNRQISLRKDRKKMATFFFFFWSSLRIANGKQIRQRPRNQGGTPGQDSKQEAAARTQIQMGEKQGGRGGSQGPQQEVE